MLGGLLNNGERFAFINYEQELKTAIRLSKEAGYAIPSKANLIILNQLLIDLKTAAGGSLAAFADLLIYANDTDSLTLGTNLGFAGIKWNDPKLIPAAGLGGLSFNTKKGINSNGTTGFINKNYIPANENITTPDDMMYGVVYSNLAATTGIHKSGFWRATANTPIQVIHLSTSNTQFCLNSLNAYYTSGSTSFPARTHLVGLKTATQTIGYANNVALGSYAGVADQPKADNCLADLASITSSPPTISANYFHRSSTIVAASYTCKNIGVNRTLIYQAFDRYLNELQLL